MELYIIRHGQSFNNALSSEDGRVADAPLTDLGKRQAEAVAQHIASAPIDPLVYNVETGRVERQTGQGFGITRLYCSAMQRALQTADAIGKAIQVVPEVWLDIHERGGIYLDEGSGRVGYPGKTRSEIMREFPGFVLPDTISEAGWWNREYEVVDGAFVRAAGVVERLMQHAATDWVSERVALVTHGTFTDCLLKTFFKQPRSTDYFYWHYNTGITRLDLGADGFLVVRYVNRIEHLTPELVS